MYRLILANMLDFFAISTVIVLMTEAFPCHTNDQVLLFMKDKDFFS